MPDAHKNFSYSTVATAPSPASSGTSLVVQSGDGAKFPATPFNATIWPAGAQPTTTNAEIVRVTNITGDTLTITRAQESTSARSVVVGDQIAATITAQTLTDVENRLVAISASNNLFSSGTVNFTGAGNITVSTAAGVVSISGSQSNQTSLIQQIAPGGNTVGTTAAWQTGSFLLAGGNNITLSQSSGTNSTNISIIGPTQSQQPMYYSASGTSTSSNTLQFGNTNGVSFSLSNGSLVASVKTDYQSSNANYLTSQSNQALSAGNGSFTFQTASFADSNGVSFSTGTQGIYASHNALTSQSNQALSAANGSFTFQTASFANSNGVSFSTGTQGIYASHNGLTQQSTQPVAVSAANGSFNFSTLTLANSNGLSFSTGTQGVYGSYTVPTQTVQPAINQIQVGGNTVGTNYSLTTGSLQIFGGNNITLSQNSSNSNILVLSVGNYLTTAAQVSQVVNSVNGSTGQISLNVGSSLSSSQNGSSITFGLASNITTALQSANANYLTTQSNQTSLIQQIAPGGNTAGTTAAWQTGSFLLAGGNNITLSQSSGTNSTNISIIGPTQSVQPAVGSLNGSSGTMSVSASQNITAVNNASTIVLNGPANILNSLSISGNTGTTNSSAISGGGFVIAGGSNITLSQSNNTISLHAQSQSVQPAVGSLNGSSGTLSVSASQNITAVNNASTIILNGPANILNSFSISGNTGTTNSSNITGGGFVLAGGANVTLSQSNNTISIVGGAGGAAGTNTFGISNLGNTAGTSGTINGTNAQLLFAGGNNITLSQSINGSSATITISAFNQSVQPAVGSLNGSSGTMSVSASQNITAVNNASTIVLNGPANILNSLSISGNTGTTNSSNITGGGFVIAGGNNITISQSNNTISLHGAQGSVAFSNSNGVTFGTAAVGVSTTVTASVSTYASVVYGLSVSGNTATTNSSNVFNTGFALAGGNNITLSQSNNTISIVGGAGGAAGTNTFGISNLGNTAGTSGTINGTNAQLIFAGSNNITLSQSINGSSATITVSGPANILNSFSIGGNTGTTNSSNITGGGFVIAGGNNVTLSQSNNTISIIGGAGAGNGSGSFGISNLGNTAGTSGTINGSNVRVLFAGGNNITLSQSLNGSSATITISAGAGGGGVALANSETTFTSGTLNLLEGGGAITIASSAGGQSFKFSVPASSSLSAQSNITIGSTGSTIGFSVADGIKAIGVSTDAIGTTGSNVGTYWFSEGNNITLSQITSNNSSHTIIISAANAAAGPAIEFFEPLPFVSNISSAQVPAIGAWYVQSFSVPSPGVDSGRINNLGSFGATSNILLATPGGSSFASNTSGSRQITYSHAETFALYSRGAGTNSTRMDSFWANTWGVGLYQTVSVSTSNVSQISVNNSVSIDIVATVGTDGNYTRQTFQATHAQAFASSSTSAAVTSGISSILNILSGAIVIPVGFNTSLSAGVYWLAQAWSSSSTTAGSSITGNSVWPLVNRVAIPNIASTHTFRYFGSTVSTVGSLNMPGGVGTHTGATASQTANMVFSNIRSLANNPRLYFNIMQSVAQST